LELEGEAVLLGLIQLDDQAAVSGRAWGFQAPGEDLVSLNACDFTGALQEQDHSVQVTLHDFEVEQGGLTHEAGPEADLGEHFSSVEKFPFRGLTGLFPGEGHAAIGRQITPKFSARPFRARRAYEFDPSAFRQACERDRLQGTRRHAELERVPSVFGQNRGIELNSHGEFAGLIEAEEELALVESEAALRGRLGIRKGDAA
jgi:hypothetical protein